MSYRAFRAYYENYTRDQAGIAGLLSNNAVETLHPLDALIDDRTTTVLKFAAAAADHYIDIDLGTSAGTVDTLIIPVGHTLDGIALDLLGDTFTPPTTSRDTLTPSDDSVIKMETASLALRYWRFKMNTSGAHELPGLILTEQAAFASHGVVMREAEDSFRHSFQRFEQPSGINPTLELGLRRRVMTLEFRNPLSGTDLTDMRSWISTVGMHRPFWIDPPSFSATPDTDDPVTPYKFEGEPEAAWGAVVPNTELDKHTFLLRLIESLD